MTSLTIEEFARALSAWRLISRPGLASAFVPLEVAAVLANVPPAWLEARLSAFVERLELEHFDTNQPTPGEQPS